MLRKGGVLCGKKFSFYYRQVCAAPAVEKIERGGEDAFLSLPNVQAVLDGVSWWRENAGVNAGLYSAALARSMYEYVEEELLGDAPASSYRLLERGYESCKYGDVLGTCTALVATLQEPQDEVQSKDHYELILLESPSTVLPEAVPSIVSTSVTPQVAKDAVVSSLHATSGFAEDCVAGSAAAATPAGSTWDLHRAFAGWKRCDGVDNHLLDVAFVGDCSLMLIRNGRVCYVSEEQVHQLDYPYQLGTGSRDTPKSSVRLLLPVEKGDVVVMGTDGIFDNVYPQDIAELLWPPIAKVFRHYGYTVALTGKEGATATAFHQSYETNRNLRTALIDDIMAALDAGSNAVMGHATAVSRDIHGNSPYASKCIEQGALFKGGKPDDMTLLVSVIGECDDDNSGERFSGSETAYPPPYRDWP